MNHLIAIFLLFSVPLMFAQEIGKEEEPKRTCRLIWTNKPVDAPQEAYIFDGKKSHKTLLPSLNLSEVIELPIGEINLGLIEQGIDDPELFPVGAPSLKIPANYRDIYLFLTSDPSNEIFPAKIEAINIEKDKLKVGHTLWVNMSDDNIGTKLGNVRVIIPAKKMAITTPPLDKSGYYLAEFAYQRDAKGDYQPIMKKSWWFDETSRNIGFILNKGAKMPEIFMIRDRRAK